MTRAWSPTVARYRISRYNTVLADFKLDLIGRDVTVYIDKASVYYLLSNRERITIKGTLLTKMFDKIRHVTLKVKKTDNNDEKTGISRPIFTHITTNNRCRNVKKLLAIEDDPEPQNCTLLSDLVIRS